MTGCERCKKPTSVMTGSYFSAEMICTACDEEESAHPDYQYARDVEEDAVRGGNYNFPGVGWPGKDGRVKRP
jgi:hypothetical protein